MGFEHPAWLWLLVPWAALVVLTLRAYRKITSVPFVDLWPREEVRDERGRAWRPPPLAIVLLLMALLAGISALAQPWLASREPRIGRMSIVLDRGVNMLAGDRLQRSVDALLSAAEPLLDPHASITVIDPLQEDELVGPATLERALSRPATALGLEARIASAVHRALKSGDLVTVAGDRQYPGAITAYPTGDVENVGIVRASAKRGSCWLTLRNDSGHTRATVVLWSGESRQRHELDLPPRGTERRYELKCPNAFPLRITLELEDALSDDNHWWVMPEEVPARLTVHASAPDWLKRFAAGYATARPPAELSAEVLITAEQSQVDGAVSVSPDEQLISTEAGPVPDHPVLRHVALPPRILAGGPLPAGEWQVLWEAAGRPLLAVSDSPRSVWIGFRPDGDITPQYLILLANAVDFCSGVSCSSGEPQVLEAGWQPLEGPASDAQMPGVRAGLYRNGRRYHAINVSAPDLRPIATSASLGQELAAAANLVSRQRLAPWLWLTAAVLATAAAGVIGSPGTRREISL